MIKSFRHNGLKKLYEKGDGRRVSPEHVEERLRIVDRRDAWSKQVDPVWWKGRLTEPDGNEDIRRLRLWTRRGWLWASDTFVRKLVTVLGRPKTKP